MIPTSEMDFGMHGEKSLKINRGKVNEWYLHFGCERKDKKHGTLYQLVYCKLIGKPCVSYSKLELSQYFPSKSTDRSAYYCDVLEVCIKIEKAPLSAEQP